MPKSDLLSIDILSEENVKNNILPHYGLETATVSQIKFKDTDKQRVVYKLEHSSQNYCLKKVYYSAGELLFIYSAIEWFCRHNINVPRILPTLSRHRFVDYNDMLFILTPWIDGEKCSYDNVDHILLASSNLAKMHKVSENFFPIQGSTFRDNYEDLGSSLNKHMLQILNSSNLAFKYNDKFSRLFLDNFEDSMYLADTASKISNTIDISNLSRSICHLDYVNKNLIFDSKNSIWVIDFDKCKSDYCIHDISYFLRRLLKRDNTKWDLELAINCLNQYETIHPLNFDEYKSIFVYLAFPQKYWKISRDYYNNIRKCNQNSFVTLLSKAVEKNDYQIQFVDSLRSYIEDKFSQKMQ